MITLGDFKTYYAKATVNQALLGASSLMGQIIHWATTDLISMADFWWNRGSGTFSTVANQAEYFLSNKVSGDKIWGMFDQTNNREIHKKDPTFFYNSYDATPDETGDPGFWMYVGQEECQGVPAVAGVMTAVSSNASDTSIEVVLRGISNGVEMYEIITLNGTTPVSGTVSWDVNMPVGINIERAAQGLVTVTRGAVTMSQIPPGSSRVQKPHIRLGPVPGGVSTINYFFYKRSVPLVRDSEIVDLPDEAFKALRYSVEEITYLLVGKLQASANAYNKRKEATADLISWSERDIGGNEIKDYKPVEPYAARLPSLIDGQVIA